MRLGEINLFVRDLPRSEAFYRDALGFQRYEESEPPGEWLKLKRDEVILLFFRAPPTAEACGTGREPGMSADLHVEDFDATYAALAAAGADLEEAQEEQGFRFVVFRDPDGIRWELLSRLT